MNTTCNKHESKINVSSGEGGMNIKENSNGTRGSINHSKIKHKILLDLYNIIYSQE